MIGVLEDNRNYQFPTRNINSIGLFPCLFIYSQLMKHIYCFGRGWIFEMDLLHIHPLQLGCQTWGLTKRTEQGSIKIKISAITKIASIFNLLIFRMPCPIFHIANNKIRLHFMERGSSTNLWDLMNQRPLPLAHSLSFYLNYSGISLHLDLSYHV